MKRLMDVSKDREMWKIRTTSKSIVFAYPPEKWTQGIMTTAVVFRRARPWPRRASATDHEAPRPVGQEDNTALGSRSRLRPGVFVYTVM
ncbi:hypothetical protein EVAR_18386_1 [Eumeta japonica]|uniref:Uncharacterized protein n=1 Tax=Eumeta variegata TaxID=151549 RepID=A0A4C1UV88_EUMVA|nr:hypothetical protein EVAR_18386_1 [Eumeta japonica]